MYAICLNDKPAKLSKLYKNEEKHQHDHAEDDSYLVGSTKKAAAALYVHHFGFTWKERPGNVSVEKLEVAA